MTHRERASVLTSIMKRLFLVWLSAIGSLANLNADVVLPPLISENMLLQHSKPVIWGKADPEEKITATLGTASLTVAADHDGGWRIEFPPIAPGPVGDLVVSGKNTLTVRNVAAGDVWVASGQSNMNFAVDGVLNSREEISRADNPEIRMFTVSRKVSHDPLDSVSGRWEICSPESVAHWSAVAFFFARQLQRDLGKPIGVISSSWGGTTLQVWTPAEVIDADPEFKEIFRDRWLAQIAKSQAAAAERYRIKLSEWEKAAEESKASGSPEPAKPSEPPKPEGSHLPSALYNGMIFGATRFPIKGAIWYQGESNANDADHYEKFLAAMIASWRKAWNIGDFPFLIVQLANYMPRREDPADSFWANLRDAQRRTALSVPNTGLAIAIDVGEAANIHPRNKQEVGRRLALVAEAKVYNRPIVFSGPMFKEAKFNSGQAQIFFQPGSAIGLATSDGGKIKGFALAGGDRKFFWAEARIVETPGGPAIEANAPAVPNPVAVRYAWADNPDCNLVNGDHLPACPFRTDDWAQIRSRPPQEQSTPVPSP